MPQETKTATSTTTYSMQMAQLHVADFPASRRGLGAADETPRSLADQRQGPPPLAEIIDSLDHALPFPKDLRSFLAYCTVLFLIVAGMMIHVLLSAQILQSEVRLAELQNRHELLERQNGELLWRIGRATNLQSVQVRAIAEGYVPIATREFVRIPVPGQERNGLALVRPEVEPGALIQDTPPAKVDGQRSANPAQPLSQWRALLFQDNEAEVSTAIFASVDDAAGPGSFTTGVEVEPRRPSWDTRVVDRFTTVIDRIVGR
jgi:hypothetical protein